MDFHQSIRWQISLIPSRYPTAKQRASASFLTANEHHPHRRAFEGLETDPALRQNRARFVSALHGCPNAPHNIHNTSGVDPTYRTLLPTLTCRGSVPRPPDHRQLDNVIASSRALRVHFEFPLRTPKCSECLVRSRQKNYAIPEARIHKHPQPARAIAFPPLTASYIARAFHRVRY